MNTEKFKNVAIGLSAIGAIVVSAFLAFHTILLEDQQRRDTSALEQQGSHVLTEVSGAVAEERQQINTQLQAFHDQQVEVKGLLKKWNLITDAIIGKHGQPGMLAHADGVIENLAKNSADLSTAIKANSEESQNALKAVSNSLDGVGAAVNSVHTATDNLSGLVGASGSTGTLREVVARVSSTIGEKNQPGTLSSTVAHADSTAQEVQGTAEEVHKGTKKANAMLDDLGSGQNTPFTQKILGAAVAKVIGPAMEWVWNRFTTLRVKTVNPTVIKQPLP